MIKGYGIDIDTNGKEIDEDYLINIIEETLKLNGIDLVNCSCKQIWKTLMIIKKIFSVKIN